MNRPRFPRAPTAIFALLAASVALAACGGGGEADPREAIENATLEGVGSGQVEVSATLSSEGEDGGDLELSLEGSFQEQGADQLPLLDLTASADGGAGGQSVDFEGGLTLLPNSAYVGLDGQLYEVDPTTFSFVESAFEQAEREAGGKAAATACQKAAAELELARFVKGAEAEGGVDVGGETTTKVSGEIDLPAAIDQILSLARDPACSSVVGATGPLPDAAEIRESVEEIEDSVKSASAEVYVGEDGIVRRAVFDMTFVGDGGGQGAGGVDMTVEMRLSEIDEEQDISAPEGNARPVTDLFQRLGINPLDALAALQGEGDIGALIEKALGSIVEPEAPRGGGSAPDS